MCGSEPHLFLCLENLAVEPQLHFTQTIPLRCFKLYILSHLSVEWATSSFGTHM